MLTIEPFLLKIFDGKPDLTVDVVPAKSIIFGGPQPAGMAQESSLVTFTVHNELLFLPGPLKPEEPNVIPAFGSDVAQVVLRVSLAPAFTQIGGISLPAGFSATITPSHQLIFFYGGPISAGGSADFVIEVIGRYNNRGRDEYIWAKVDPRNRIAETDKTNNVGFAKIWVWSIS